MSNPGAGGRMMRQVQLGFLRLGCYQECRSRLDVLRWVLLLSLLCEVVFLLLFFVLSRSDMTYQEAVRAVPSLGDSSAGNHTIDSVGTSFSTARVQNTLAGGTTSSEGALIDSTSHNTGHDHGSPSSGSEEKSSQEPTIVPTTPGELELAQALAKLPNARETFVMLSFSTIALAEFALNWHKTVAHKLGLRNALLAANDQEMFEFAVQHGIPSFREFLLEAPSSIEEFRGVLTWGGGGGGFESHKFKNAKEKTGFQTLGVRKAFMLLKIVQLGYNVLVSDVDTSWLQDPHPFFLSEPRARADTWLMSDCLSASMEERGLSCVTLTEFNTGVMYIRATNNSQVLMQSWLEELAATTNPNLHDQNVLNIAIQRQRCKPLQAGVDDAPGAPRSSRVVTTELHGATVALGLLSPAEFCNGHNFFVQQMSQRLGIEAILVHCTHQFSGPAGKRQRLRDWNLWLVDDDAYFTGNKYLQLSWDSMLDDMLRGLYQNDTATNGHIGTVIYDHLDIANRQRTAVRNALVLAQVTGRILILPSLVCACDRYWSPFLPGCIVPGADFPKIQEPIRNCPMDHMLFIPNWIQEGAEFRGPGFLREERVRQQGLTTAILGEVRSRFSITREDLQQRLLPVAADVLEVGMSTALNFCGVRDAKAQSALDAKLAKVMWSSVQWCGPERNCIWGYDLPPRLDAWQCPVAQPRV
mmetsp:Transcript_13481/g.49045  ORF Transcript_13481/g.49045 Transcript_13481/m.49045 type:complete len:696 (-) Transcript_13481:289-2376(-)